MRTLIVKHDQNSEFILICSTFQKNTSCLLVIIIINGCHQSNPCYNLWYKDIDGHSDNYFKLNQEPNSRTNSTEKYNAEFSEITERKTLSWEGSLRARRSTQVRLETALPSEFFLFTFHHSFLLRFHSSVTGQGSIQLGVNFPGTFPTKDDISIIYIFFLPSTAESLLSAIFLKWDLFIFKICITILD